MALFASAGTHTHTHNLLCQTCHDAAMMQPRNPCSPAWTHPPPRGTVKPIADFCSVRGGDTTLQVWDAGREPPGGALGFNQRHDEFVRASVSNLDPLRKISSLSWPLIHTLSTQAFCTNLLSLAALYLVYVAKSVYWLITTNVAGTRQGARGLEMANCICHDQLVN